MEKRLVSFLITMTLVMTGWIMLRNAIVGPPVPPKQVADAKVAQDGEAADPAEGQDNPAAGAEGDQAEDDQAEDDEAAPAADGEDAEAKTAATGSSEAGDPAAADEESESAQEAEAERAVVLERLSTFGSLDPASGYRMLVYWCNQGAVIDRVEFSSPNYQDLNQRYGYLGYLALSHAKQGGVRVNVVGPGTPASLAQSDSGEVGLKGPSFSEDGLSVSAEGDRISALNGVPVDNAIEFERALGADEAR